MAGHTDQVRLECRVDELEQRVARLERRRAPLPSKTATMTAAEAKAIRLALGASLRAFANLVGVSAPTLLAWEAGRTTIDHARAYRIKRAQRSIQKAKR